MATQVSVSEPPAFLRDYYAALAQRGMNLGNLGFTQYNQQRVAPLNEQQQAAAQMVQQRALSGSGAMNQAGNFFGGMMGGQYNVGNVSAGQNPYAGQNNPYLQQNINNAMGDVESRIDSKFNNNAFGGTAHQQTLARELGRVSNDMRSADYTQQMGLAENNVNRQLQAGQFNAGTQGQNVQRQMATLPFAQNLAANDYQDANAMMGIGNQLQGHNQNIANANYQEFNRALDYPGQQLAYMQAGLNPSASAFLNSSTTASDPKTNPIANAAGGAMTGYALGNMMGFSPGWGAAGGGLLGLLGG